MTPSPRKPATTTTRTEGASTGLLAVMLVLVACSNEQHSVAPNAATPVAESAKVHFLDPPSGPGAKAPNLALGREGPILSWLQPVDAGGGHALFLAELRGEQWTPAHQIAAGDAFFANWADLPMVSEAADGTRFAHWLQMLGTDTYAYGAELARSRDGGESWQRLGLLHDDATPAEHGFVSYAPLTTGGVQAFWLDGRQMPAGGDMQLRTTLLGEGDPGTSTVLDDRVCECCATDAATTSVGPVVVYRNRGPSEVRDIAIVRATGDGWSEPVVIHEDSWQIHGCPVNGPAIAAAGDQVAVAWFTAAQAKAIVQVAFSRDGGAHFAAPISVDTDKPIGRVDVALTADGRAVVSWLGTTGNGAEIRWRQVGQEGEPGPVRVVTTTTAARSAGVPRMMHRDGELFFAWVEDAESSRLRVGRVTLD